MTISPDDLIADRAATWRALDIDPEEAEKCWLAPSVASALSSPKGRAYGVDYTTRKLFVGIEPVGFRDLYWCAHQNEPAIVYSDKKCRECGSVVDDDDHEFLGHVMKP